MRYVSLPAHANEWWEAKSTDYLAKTITEAENKPVFTGLLDAAGAKLYRIEDRQPIGFIRHDPQR